jgi:hypothetical protein
MVMKANAVQSETLTIPAGEFKAKCLKLMDEAVTKQQRFSITKRGKVVGEFVPAPREERPFRSIVGRSPNIRIPSEAQWAKLKNEWADEWDQSAKNFVRDFLQPKSKKK